MLSVNYLLLFLSFFIAEGILSKEGYYADETENPSSLATISLVWFFFSFNTE